jgi:hypothetical protein
MYQRSAPKNRRLRQTPAASPQTGFPRPTCPIRTFPDVLGNHLPGIPIKPDQLGIDSFQRGVLRRTNALFHGEAVCEVRAGIVSFSSLIAFPSFMIVALFRPEAPNRFPRGRKLILNHFRAAMKMVYLLLKHLNKAVHRFPQCHELSPVRNGLFAFGRSARFFGRWAAPASCAT